MFPIEHAVVGLVPVLAYALIRDRRLPSLRLLGIGLVGSQFPDLIDKPLAHQFHLLPSGRVFVHSLPIAIPVICLVGWYAWRTDRPRVGGVFAFTYLSHVAADNYRALWLPKPTLSDELLWPLRAVAPQPASPRWAGPGSINVQLWTLFSLVVVLVCAYYLCRDVAAHYGSDAR